MMTSGRIQLLGFPTNTPRPLPKICIVSSSGGHLTEVRTLKPAYDKYDHFYVLNERIALPEDMEGMTC
jgi:hypothetical protein